MFPALQSAVSDLVSLVVTVTEESPEAEDVVAGWTAFAIFGLLILAVAVLGFSLNKRLRNAARSEAEGRYDPPTKPRPSRPTQPPPTKPTSEPE